MALACIGLGTPAADPDGDGFNNLLEVALGSSPSAADSRPALTAATTTVSGQRRMTLTFTPGRIAGLRYSIEASSDLTTWSEVHDVTASTTPGQPLTFTDSADLAASRRFLRVRVQAD